MGRFLKNSQLKTGSYSIRIPVTDNALASPDVLVNGLIRYNELTSAIEFAIDGQWRRVAKIGKVSVETQELTGDNTQTDFVLSNSIETENDIQVFIGGVYQQPGLNYEAQGTTLTFFSPPPAPGINPNKIVVVYNLNSTDAA